MTQPDACNLGKVSAHAVVGTADFKASTAGAAAIRQLVTAARPNSTFLTAAKAVNASTLLFQNATVELQVCRLAWEICVWSTTGGCCISS